MTNAMQSHDSESGLNEFARRANDAYFKFCNTIITLATGAIMLSMLILENMDARRYLPLIILSWACYAVSLLCALVVKWGEVVVNIKAVRLIADGERSVNVGPGRTYDICERGMIICFFIAVVFMMAFAASNLLIH